MPYSSVEGKDFIKAFFTPDKYIRHVVDIGPGAGTYYDLLQPSVAADWWTAVEIWAPYIEQFRLRDKYNEVIISDAYWLDWDRLGVISLTILGDVIEHISYVQAESILERAVARSRYVVLSLPIIHYPQGTEMGNPYEAHVQHYTPESVDELLLADYNVVGRWEGEVVGVYIIDGYAVPEV